MDEPNVNIIIITAIEGLTSEVNREISQLTPETVEQQFRLNEAVKRIKELQGYELHELRKVFE